MHFARLIIAALIVVHITAVSTNEPNSTQVAFVTVIAGPYEATVKKQAFQSIRADFILFTDRPDIEHEEAWKVVDINKYKHGINELDKATSMRNNLAENQHVFNRAKFIKLNLHRLPELAAYDIVVWLDGTVELRNGRVAQDMLDLADRGYPVASFRHSERQGILDNEVRASNGAKYTHPNWLNDRQPVQKIPEQYESYLSSGFSEGWIFKHCPEKRAADDGIWVTCFVSFDMRSPITKSFLRFWWLENLRHSTQDQVSFPFVAWSLGVCPYSFPDGFVQGTADYNDYYIKHPHGVK